MTIHDVVLDTNVLLHAANPIEPRFGDALNLVTALVDSTTALCVDEGFDFDETKNRSLVGAEYLEKLVVGTPGHALITKMALEGRVVFVKASMPAGEAKKLNQMLANRRDRTFIKVAAASGGKTLVSHDYHDFPAQKRADIGRLFRVVVQDAAATLPVVA